MSGGDHDAPEAADIPVAPTLETVHLAVLGLLSSVPERPERLLVRAADVSVELDWRPHATPARTVAAPVPVPAVHIESGGQQVVAAVTVEAPEPASSAFVIAAPAVGTFYHAPDPGRPPFVVPGMQVVAGQQVGIVEAMKLMLPVEAERGGQVLRVLVDDGKPVQYGDPLIELGPSGST
jgi:acetyl-CoA carboxylase biotin carboxyl carrier protein